MDSDSEREKEEKRKQGKEESKNETDSLGEEHSNVHVLEKSISKQQFDS